MSELEFEKQREEDPRLNDSFLDSLKEFMDEEEIKEMNIQDPETFKIQSKEQANYFIKKIMDIRTEAAEINTIADNEIAKTTTRVNAWRESQLTSKVNDEEYIAALLQEYTMRELAASNGKTKSIKLPYGSIGFKKQQPKYDYNEDVLLPFLKENKKDLVNVKVTEAPNKTELKKVATVVGDKLYIDGKEVPGVVVTPQDDKFEVK